MLAFLAMVVLMVPLMRYVDDYFSAGRSETVRHAMQCFARYSPCLSPSCAACGLLLCRLVRAVLGPSSLAERKLLAGNPLVVLGISVSIIEQGVHFWPEECKVQKWIRRIDIALELQALCGGEASKLAGALQWAGQKMFKRMGRAMLRPIIQ